MDIELQFKLVAGVGYGGRFVAVLRGKGGVGDRGGFGVCVGLVVGVQVGGGVGVGVHIGVEFGVRVGDGVGVANGVKERKRWESVCV